MVEAALADVARGELLRDALLGFAFQHLELLDDAGEEAGEFPSIAVALETLFELAGGVLEVIVLTVEGLLGDAEFLVQDFVGHLGVNGGRIEWCLEVVGMLGTYFERGVLHGLDLGHGGAVLEG